MHATVKEAHANIATLTLHYLACSAVIAAWSTTLTNHLHMYLASGVDFAASGVGHLSLHWSYIITVLASAGIIQVTNCER